MIISFCIEFTLHYNTCVKNMFI